MDINAEIRTGCVFFFFIVPRVCRITPPFGGSTPMTDESIQIPPPRARKTDTHFAATIWASGCIQAAGWAPLNWGLFEAMCLLRRGGGGGGAAQGWAPGGPCHPLPRCLFPPDLEHHPSPPKQSARVRPNAHERKTQVSSQSARGITFHTSLKSQETSRIDHNWGLIKV